MKWFLVVVSLISNHPGGHKDMWVVAKYYESEQQCVISGGESNIGLLARAHKEFDYYKSILGCSHGMFGVHTALVKNSLRK